VPPWQYCCRQKSCPLLRCSRFTLQVLRFPGCLRDCLPQAPAGGSSVIRAPGWTRSGRERMSEWQRLRMPTTTRRRGRLLRHEQSREATTREQSNNGFGSSPHASGASQGTALRLPTGTFRWPPEMLDTVPWCTCPHSQASLGSRARLCRAHAASTHTTRSVTWPLMRYSLGPAQAASGLSANRLQTSSSHAHAWYAVIFGP